MRGKLDQLSYALAKRPHSTIASVFTECHSLTEQKDKGTRLELENKLRREIKSKNRSFLFKVVPALRRINGGD